METRRDVHYKRNTVIAPHPNRKNREKRQRMAGRKDRPLKIMERQKKVCATSVCVWCNNDMKVYRVVCRFCRTCQYCGLQPDNPRDCNFCGNQLPKELRQPLKWKRRVTVI